MVLTTNQTMYAELLELGGTRSIDVDDLTRELPDNVVPRTISRRAEKSKLDIPGLTRGEVDRAGGCYRYRDDEEEGGDEDMSLTVGGALEKPTSGRLYLRSGGRGC